VAKIKKVTKPDEAQHSTTPLKKKRSFCWTDMILSQIFEATTCKIFAYDGDEKKNTCVINPKKKICHLKALETS